MLIYVTLFLFASHSLNLRDYHHRPYVQSLKRVLKGPLVLEGLGALVVPVVPVVFQNLNSPKMVFLELMALEAPLALKMFEALALLEVSFGAPLALKVFEALILKTHPLEALLALETFGALLPPLKMGSGSEEVHGLE